MATFKRMDTRPGVWQQFLSELPGIIGQFMSLKDSREQRKEEREYREKIRLEELENRKLFRAEDLANRQIEIEANRQFQMNMKWRGELNEMYDNKITEYNTQIAKYEQIAGKADKALALDQTDSFVDILGTDFTASSEELIADIGALKELIVTANNTIETVKGRNLVLGDIQYEISKRTDGYKYYLKSEEELAMGMPLWTQEDFEHMMKEITNDEDFLKRNGFMDKDGNMKGELPQYLTQYIEGMSTPDDAKLQSLNAELFKHEATKLQLSINQFNKTLKQRELELTLSPDVIYAQELTTLTQSAQKIDAGLAFIPGFTPSYTKNFQVAQRYEEAMNTAEVQNLHNPDIVKGVAKRALAAGVITDKQLKNFTSENARSFIKMEASMNMIKESPLAVIVGPAYLRSVYAREHRSYAAYANLLTDASAKINEYYISDKKTKAQMEVDFAKAMGLVSFDYSFTTLKADIKENVTKMIDAALLEIETIVGTDADLVDNSFSQAMGTLKGVEDGIRELIINGPTSAKMKEQELGLYNNSSIQLAITGMAASCTSSGGEWMESLGECDNTKTTKLTPGVPLRLMKDIEEEQKLREEWNKLHENTPGAEIYDIQTGEVKYN